MKVIKNNVKKLALLGTLAAASFCGIAQAGITHIDHITAENITCLSPQQAKKLIEQNPDLVIPTIHITTDGPEAVIQPGIQYATSKEQLENRKKLLNSINRDNVGLIDPKVIAQSITAEIFNGPAYYDSLRDYTLPIVIQAHPKLAETIIPFIDQGNCVEISHNLVDALLEAHPGFAQKLANYINKDIIGKLQYGVIKSLITTDPSLTKTLASYITKDNFETIWCFDVYEIIERDKSYIPLFASYVTKENAKIKDVACICGYMVDKDPQTATTFAQLITKENIGALADEEALRKILTAYPDVAPTIIDCLSEDSIHKMDLRTIIELLKIDPKYSATMVQHINHTNIDKVWLQVILSADPTLVDTVAQYITQDNFDKLTTFSLSAIVKSNNKYGPIFAAWITQDNLKEVRFALPEIMRADPTSAPRFASYITKDNFSKIPYAIEYIVEAYPQAAQRFASYITAENITQLSNPYDIPAIIKAYPQSAERIIGYTNKDTLHKIFLDQSYLSSYQFEQMPLSIQIQIIKHAHKIGDNCSFLTSLLKETLLTIIKEDHECAGIILQHIHQKIVFSKLGAYETEEIRDIFVASVNKDNFTAISTNPAFAQFLNHCKDKKIAQRLASYITHNNIGIIEPLLFFMLLGIDNHLAPKLAQKYFIKENMDLLCNYYTSPYSNRRLNKVINLLETFPNTVTIIEKQIPLHLLDPQINAAIEKAKRTVATANELTKKINSNNCIDDNDIATIQAVNFRTLCHADSAFLPTVIQATCNNITMANPFIVSSILTKDSTIANTHIMPIINSNNLPSIHHSIIGSLLGVDKSHAKTIAPYLTKDNLPTIPPATIKELMRIEKTLGKTLISYINQDNFQQMPPETIESLIYYDYKLPETLVPYITKDNFQQIPAETVINLIYYDKTLAQTLVSYITKDTIKKTDQGLLEALIEYDDTAASKLLQSVTKDNYQSLSMKVKSLLNILPELPNGYAKCFLLSPKKLETYIGTKAQYLQKPQSEKSQSEQHVRTTYKSVTKKFADRLQKDRSLRVTLQNVIAHEEIEHKKGRYTIAHGRNSGRFVPDQIWIELQELFYKKSIDRTSWYPLHWRLPGKYDSTGKYINKPYNDVAAFIKNGRTNGADRSSVNFASDLFGCKNGSSALDYALRNSNVNNYSTSENIKELFTYYGWENYYHFGAKYFDRAEELAEQMKYGTLLLYSFTPEALERFVFVTHASGAYKGDISIITSDGQKISTSSPKKVLDTLLNEPDKFVFKDKEYEYVIAVCDDHPTDKTKLGTQSPFNQEMRTYHFNLGNDKKLADEIKLLIKAGFMLIKFEMIKDGVIQGPPKSRL